MECSLSSGNATMQVASEQVYLQSEYNATSEIITISRASNWAKSTAGLLAAQCTLYIYPYTQSLKRGVKINTTHSTLKFVQLGVQTKGEKLPGKCSFQCSGSANIEVPFCLGFSFFVLLYLRLRYAFNMKKAFHKSRPRKLS